MGRVVWKEGAVFSVETRKGLFTLGQMSREPFAFFFALFRAENQFEKNDLRDAEPLFCVSVTRHFLRHSRIEKQKHVHANAELQIPDRWIHPTADRAHRVVARGTPMERRAYLPVGASLVRKDVMGHRGGPYRHPSGVYDEVLIPSLSPADTPLAEPCETTSLAVFPSLNERLYLCHLAARRVSPWADLVLDRPMPESHAVYLDLVFPNPEATPEEKAALRALFV